MKKILFAVAVVALGAAPGFAQSRSVDVSGFASWIDVTGENVIEEDASGNTELEFESEQGFGGAINVFWGNRVSTEFAASVFEPEASVRVRSASRSPIGRLDMIPITATLQYHFAPDSRVDPYIGAGVAYVLFDEFDDDDLDDLGFGTVDVDDDYGVLVNAGLSIDITPNFAILLDGKYVPLETSISTAGVDDAGDLEINPLILSAGVSFQF